MKVSSILALAGAMLLASPADAASFIFEVSGDTTTTFTIDEADFHLGNEVAFFVFNVEATNLPGGIAELLVWSGFAGGGFSLHDIYTGDYLVDAQGEELFTGPITAPMMKTGQFSLANYNGELRYDLVIRQAAAVPEPATWFMMIGGFALIGGALRYRPKLSNKRSLKLAD